jgi:large subunit ribosomal protein L23
MALLWQKGNKKGAEDTAKADKKSVAKAPAKKAEKVEKTKKVESQAEKRAAASAGVVFPKGSAVIRPRITEKAGLLSERRVYTFDVRVDANARQIGEAIEAAYKVTPIGVSVLPVKSKAMFVRGKSGKTVRGKKAYVYLKEGDKIEFI